jgi:penicillin-binding protein 2
MVVATAGLMEGIITTKSTEFCTGLFTEITPSPKCWQTWGHGSENVVTAIRDSCNQYFYNVGYSLATRNGIYDAQAGLDTLYYYADLFGLTSKSGIEISESAPTVSTQDPVRSAIGQGSNSYTTVGLARYVATVANGGTCMDLTLLDKLTDSEGNVVKEFETKVRNVIDMPQSYWDAIHTGMRMVVEGKSYFKDLAVSVAGKTGTAEQIKNRANHALFVGYAPYEEPEIAIATRIPYGYSSDYAAQTTKDILKYYYRLEAEEDLITGEADAPEGGISNEL